MEWMDKVVRVGRHSSRRGRILIPWASGTGLGAHTGVHWVEKNAEDGERENKDGGFKKRKRSGYDSTPRLFRGSD